ncbi:MAG TPA: ferredoxin reductase [Solirubrobacterales bacterium]|jgi:ferredoxin-NADP reductase|nr:ferredoxin reductase [Solirubrobacterales bacterium]
MTPPGLPTPLAPLRSPARRLLRSGLLEALAAPHGVDRYLELVHPTRSLRGPQAELIAVRRQTVDSVTMTLRPSDGWHGFRAGQFIRLTIEVAGVLETRCYSPACGEQAEGQVEITVKAHPAGKVSRYLNEHARPGMVVGMSAAGGDFVLPRERPERLLLISSGSGITPVMSMLRTLCAEGHGGTVTFLHYARTGEDVVYRPELAEIAARHPNVRIVLVHTREATAGGLAGHISREHLHRVGADHRRAHTYVCGAPGLIAWVRATWAEDGIEQLLHVESFLPASFTVGGAGTEGSVDFARSGERVLSDGGSLLEQAEQAGLCPQFGCRMGICRICTCRKTAGSVRNVLNGEISGAEEEDIQICVSVPVGDVELAL